MQTISFPGTGYVTSRLGLGCMRLPMNGDTVDERAAIAMIRKAIDNGVNYVDTAYPYHNGISETVLGKALQDGYREKVVLATKLPVWKVTCYEDMEILLDEQLAKLQTNYVDFYLLHALEKARFQTMKELGYARFLNDMLQKGKIKFPAFSFHDDYDCFISILNDYPWAMAQVQMNLLDTNNQATLKGIKAAYEKGVAIVVMEPLRGGALSKAPANVQALYDAYPVKRSPVEWALRFLYDMPEVAVVLSGMSNEEQLMQNIESFRTAEMGAMDESEKALIREVEKAYNSRIKTGCTGCEYCQPCPMEIKIPHIFRGYDRALMFDSMGDFNNKYEKCADKCLECGACESACPQHLPIIQYIKEIEASAE